MITGWEHGATSDPEQISRWWHDAPYNIAIACGPANLIVIDLDQGNGGPPPEAFPGAGGGGDVLEILAARAGEPVPWDTFTVATPTSGGLHLYFTAPEGQQLRNTAGSPGAGLGWKIDTRAHGGYVVAAGSVSSAGMYRVVNNQPVAALPGWLAVALTRTQTERGAPGRAGGVEVRGRRASAYVRAIVEDEAQAVRAAAVGTRNHVLNRAAWTLGRLVGGGELAEEDARVVLEQAAAGHVGTTGFTATEAHRTVNSGLDAGQREPRRWLQNGGSD